MRNESDGRYKKKREDAAFRSLEAKEPDEGIVFGRNAVKELLLSGKDVDKILVARGEREGSISVLVSQALERGIPLLEVDRKKLDAMCKGAAHQGIVAMAALATYVDVSDIIAYAESRGEAPMIVICDGIEDPHNLGAIIRSAECAGFHGIIIPKRHSATLTATVAKSSAGAIAHMRIAKVSNLATTIDALKKQNIWIYGADMDGSVYYETDLRGPIAIVLGSEGTGISHLVEEKCDFRLSIPLYGKVDSMNVSAAAAVLFCEAARQHFGKQ
ncbi:MAG: 23S rRNA (guanosine(2251)-2'-O)-methyltransferase RlmB [Ruminococcaceae bacterium]|nr:23S rRNA (guanosine(2251)-2'-O)-methyltransferase RlmB [Oscillospiraceae bacterium]